MILVSRFSYHSTMKSLTFKLVNFFLLAAEKQQDLDGLVGGERPLVEMCLSVYLYFLVDFVPFEVDLTK